MGGTITRIVNPDGSETRREWQLNNPVPLPPTAPVFPNTWVVREWTSVANSTSYSDTVAGVPVTFLGTPTAMSAQVFAVDKNGNQTSRQEHPWVPHSASLPTLETALRRTVSLYVNPAPDSTVTYDDVNSYSSATATATPKDLLRVKGVLSGTGTMNARDDFSYDTVGNLLEEFHWDNVKGPSAPLTTSNAIRRAYTYSPRGNVLTETDANNFATTYEYNGCGADLYRSRMTQGGHATAGVSATLPRSTLYEYSPNTSNDGCKSGLRTKVTDPNSLITTIIYDHYGRPTSFTETTESGTAPNIVTTSHRTTTHAYDDGARWIVTRNDAQGPGDQTSVSVLHFDELGRTRSARQLETTTATGTAAANETLGIRVDTKYFFGAGRNDVLVSNPYRNTETSAATRGWTVTRRDTAGRVCAEENFAGAAEPAVGTNCNPSSGITGSTRHAYTVTGSSAVPYYRSDTVTDASGKSRKLAYDVLGRLSGVIEDPTTLQYATFYTYDLNNNLTQARQVGKCTLAADPLSNPQQCTGTTLSRTFTYSSLSRLLTATNPESGTIAYQYDDNGNLLKRTQGGFVRCASATAIGGTCGPTGYDDLNRLVNQSYSDATPAVHYTYDAASGNLLAGCAGGAPIGRLTSVETTVSSNYYSYTPLGYTACSRQSTGKDYDFAYTTTPQGAIKDLTYPTGRIVRYAYDNAGRVSGVTKVATNTPYASSFSYASHGPLSGMVLGNNALTESWSYNSRLQPVTLTAGNLSLNYSYCAGQAASCSTNNGNLLYQTISRAGSTWAQNYTYDAVNRLSTAGETGAAAWNQGYGFDERGNRWVCAHTGSLPALTSETPQNINDCVSPAGWYPGGDNKIAPATWTYERGNLTSIGGMNRTFTYDGESRQSTAVINGGQSKYFYDGQGRRVRAETPTGTTVFVYDAMGQLAAEYGPNTDVGTQYVAVDHLGSTRLITDSAGAAVKCYDYLPFGETIPASAGRTGLSCYGAASDNTVDFTGKERDAESGLDYFGARYMSPAQGRFTSPDEFTGSLVDIFGEFESQPGPLPFGNPADPQSLNKYTYVRNNPQYFTDPDGHLQKVPVPNPLATPIDTGGGINLLSTLASRIVWFLSIADSGQRGGYNADEEFFREERKRNPRRFVPDEEDEEEKVPETSGGGKRNGGKKGGGKKRGGKGGKKTLVEGAQDRVLTSDEIKKLEATSGQTAHDIKIEALGQKEKISRYDLYKDASGSVFVKGKGGVGERIPTGLKVN